jgi:FAD:protein FMN transferase
MHSISLKRSHFVRPHKRFRSTPAPEVRSMPAFGTTATVAVTDLGAADYAQDLLAREIAAMDGVASRFRSDSEVSHLRRTRGRATRVSPLMFEALCVAVSVAKRTGGAVDPTVGRSVEALGYDRDFSLISTAGIATPHGVNTSFEELTSVAAPGWHTIELDPERRTVRIPPGTLVDLGATAKALSADRAAESIARLTGSGTLVSIGGDVAVSGTPPAQGWAIGIAHSSSAQPHELQQVVAVESGGLATSSTTVRAWTRNGRAVHHIVDPSTGLNTRLHWIAVSVAASSCVEANAASTAAFIWGRSATRRLALAGLPARLESITGDVSRVCGWPEDASDPCDFAGLSDFTRLSDFAGPSAFEETAS